VAGRLWHVCLTVAGDPCPEDRLRLSLQRLSREHPFLLPGRYAADHVDIRYWEEAESCQAASALALQLWADHRDSAELPPWEVLALEVVELELYQARPDADAVALSGPSGEWYPA